MRIGVIYLVARIVTTGFFLLAAQLSTPASRFGATPISPTSYWDGTPSGTGSSRSPAIRANSL
ncbi:hypothetical protein [Microbacterium sp. NIBRBAC000506063]|uniref:hypothetical protein n=1 Tax=Microbacterium sp. NIBRBAC000506063 TaxID=2734618 RepID=UPI001CB7591C|nr:hypothetical protein [Microbacterium sp. NIBRBAC000506063]